MTRKKKLWYLIGLLVYFSAIGAVTTFFPAAPYAASRVGAAVAVTVYVVFTFKKSES